MYFIKIFEDFICIAKIVTIVIYLSLSTISFASESVTAYKRETDLEELKFSLLTVTVAQYAMLTSERSLMCGDLNYDTLRNAEYCQIRQKREQISNFIANYKELFVEYYGLNDWLTFNEELNKFLFYNNFVLVTSIKLEIDKTERFYSYEQRKNLVSAVMQSTIYSQDAVLKVNRIIENLLNTK